MDNVIQYLQSIQDNLVGLVLPVLITAVVSLVTVSINSIIQLVLQNSKYNSEQYKIMQEFYPTMKGNLLELKLAIQEVVAIPMYSDFKTAIDKYIECKNNDIQYRIDHTDEVQYIDRFNSLMNTLSIKLDSINSHLSTCKIPRVPIMHLFLKNSIKKMLASIQYYSLLWSKFYHNTISKDMFKKELHDFKRNWDIEIGIEQTEKYLLLLDKWLMKY